MFGGGDSRGQIDRHFDGPYATRRADDGDTIGRSRSRDLQLFATSEGLSPNEVERILNRESGLIGSPGLSNDMRELETAERGGNADAALAIAMFWYRVRKYIGAYAAVLGRVDAIIFGGGIGEHSANVRAQVCSDLEVLGITIDSARNEAADGREACISTDGSRIALWVVPLDEELQIARACARLLSPSASA